jgi:hypothetical protein
MLKVFLQGVEFSGNILEEIKKAFERAQKLLFSIFFEILIYIFFETPLKPVVLIL